MASKKSELNVEGVEEMMKDAVILYDTEVSKVEELVRTKLIITFCDKHSMEFDAGMGCWSLENNLVNIYGATPGYWDVVKSALAGDIDDDEYDAIVERAQEFMKLPETVEIMNILDTPTMRGATLGCNIEAYKAEKEKA